MSLKAYIEHCIILSFLAITGCAIAYCLTKDTRLLQIPFVHMSYGAMAPYQGYRTTNEHLLAVGKTPEGSLVKLDESEYFPFPLNRGERGYRARFVSFLPQGQEGVDFAYQQLAQHLLRRHPELKTVTLSFEEWPMSPEGWEARRRERIMTRLTSASR